MLHSCSYLQGLVWVRDLTSVTAPVVKVLFSVPLDEGYVFYFSLGGGIVYFPLAKVLFPSPLGVVPYSHGECHVSVFRIYIFLCFYSFVCFKLSCVLSIFKFHNFQIFVFEMSFWFKLQCVSIAFRISYFTISYVSFFSKYHVLHSIANFTLEYSCFLDVTDSFIFAGFGVR